MRKRTKIIIVVSLMAVVIFSFVFYRTFYAAHRDIASEQSQLSIMAKELQFEYTKNFIEANKVYADNVIEVSGTISTIEQSTIILDNTIQVDFLDKALPKITVGSLLTVKGRCVGYDDLLEVVKLDQAIVLTNK